MSLVAVTRVAYWGNSLARTGGELTYRITVRERFPPGHYKAIDLIPTEEELLSASIRISIE